MIQAELKLYKHGQKKCMEWLYKLQLEMTLN